MVKKLVPVDRRADVLVDERPRRRHVLLAQASAKPASWPFSQSPARPAAARSPLWAPIDAAATATAQPSAREWARADEG